MASDTTVVDTSTGRLRGARRGRHCAFLGVPFAKPPVGALRFRAPEPPEPWPGTRDAVAFSAAALQGTEFAPGVAIEGPQSEDCLYLNVFTPSPDGAKRPVLFWIHGGAFTLGTASVPLYDGRKLVETGDVVVVTSNYRLGAFGFLALGEAGARFGATANAGLLDQVRALEWVRDNIEAFGGDPGNVTIFGESAGATSVCDLLVMDRARGLFHRAISQSSAATLRLPTIEHADRTTAKLLSLLELSREDAERLLDLPAKTIVAAQAELEKTATAWRGFYPILDAATLPEHPGDALARDASTAPPLVIGTNRDEWNLFAAASILEWSQPMADRDAIAAVTRELSVEPARAEALLSVYRASRAGRGLPHDNRALLRAISGDRRFRIPSLRYAEAYQRRCPATFMYLFTYGSPALRGVLGACHALDLPFVFGTYDAPQQDRFAGSGPDVEALSRRMMGSWLSFARTGTPESAEVPSWPSFDPRRRTTLRFDVTTALEDAPFDEERRAWDGID